MAPNSNILNYRGQSELAGGYGASGIPPGTGADANNVLNSVVNGLLDKNFATNLQVYQQKIKDRDAILEGISKNQIDASVDKIYVPRLEAMRDKIRDFVTKDPKKAFSYEGQVQLKADTQKFLEEAAIAKTNSASLQALRLDYANNPDEKRRKRLEGFINEQLGQSTSNPHYLIQPFQKISDWDESIFYRPGAAPSVDKDGKRIASSTPAGNVLNTESITGPDGISYKRITTGQNLADYDRFYSPSNMVRSENREIADGVMAFYRDAQQDPSFMSEQNFSDLNNFIDTLNKQRGITPGMEGFYRPIATQNGDNTWNVEKDPLYVAKITALRKNYAPPTVQDVVDEEKMKGRLNVSTLKQNEVENSLKRAQVAKIGNDIRVDNQRLQGDLAEQREKIRKLKKENDRPDPVLQSADEVLKVTNAALNNKSYELKDKTYFAPGVNGQEIKNAAGVTSGATYTPLAIGDVVVKRGLSWPVRNEDGKVVKETLPKNAYMVRSGGNIQYVAVYDKDENGDEIKDGKYRIAVFNPSNMTTNYHSAINKWDLSDKDNESLNTIQDVIGNIGNGQTVQQQVTETVSPSGNTIVVTDETSQLREAPGGKLQVLVNGAWREATGVLPDGRSVQYK